MKTIDTLVEDILSVVDGKGGWDATVSQFFKDSVSSSVDRRLEKREEEETTKGTLRMSNMGTKCLRKLWYSVHHPQEGEPLRPETKLKFLYGDILEDLLISLAIAAGHKVEGMQDEMSILGIKGHRDCVIDGVTVDVKSASSYAFKKFKEGRLREDDPFGYISQLSSYVYAGKDDPLVVDKTKGAFLVIDKSLGSLCLDMYDFSDELVTKEKDFKYTKTIVEKSTEERLVPKAHDPVPEGKSGNMKLDVNCSYCPFKERCWPSMRTFLSSRGPVYLTEVKREPKMKEVT